ncbi:MAG TPA: ATP-binding protein [Thermoanaerobaculia bacterium]|nr:ATP-binding protein [Thermoanaerobaculia bacterium]
MIRNLPIRLRITFIVMTAATVALLIACAAFMAHEITTTHETDERNLSILADVVAANSSAALIFRDADAARDILSAVRAQQAIVSAAIFTGDGAPFVTYGTHAQDSLAIVRAKPPSRWKMIETYRTIRFRGDAIGTLHIVADHRFLRQRLKRDVAITVAILCCTLFVALLVAMYLQREISAPLVRLAGTARKVTTEKNYSVRVGTGAIHSGRDEMHAVIDAFDGMLAEVERQQATLEDNVASRTAELQMILNSAAEGIFGLDRDGAVTFINPSAATLLGWRMQDLVGRPLHPLLHAEDSPEHAADLAACVVCSAADGATSSHTASFRRSDGTAMPVELTAATIDDASGNAAGVVVTFRDITERLQVERMKDEFVSTVSHELRTPLTSIRGALTILSSGTMGSLSAKGHRMIAIAVANSERLTRLINDLLDLEKIQTAAMTLQRRPLNAEQVLQLAVEGVQPLGERTKVSLRLDAEPAELHADSDRLQQMLANLLTNAIKFSSEHAVVEVKGFVKEGDYVITVRDRGRGIPADKLEIVFERFQQVDASDSRDKGGTGLGLAISRSIVTAHGGTIYASIPEGGGTLFTVTLPLLSDGDVA